MMGAHGFSGFSKVAVSVAVALLLAFCTSSVRNADGPLKAGFDREFELRSGERAQIDQGGFTIEFVRLLHDSRCPSDVTCIQEGNAEIEVAVQREDMPAQTLILSTSRRERQEQRFDVYTVRLVQLVPYPRTDLPTRETDYGATLLITRG